MPFILGDNLEVMSGMPGESVDLIYADPPYNSGRDYGEFNDKWPSMDAYIAFMHERAVEMKRLLKPTGSLYLHCDTSASHYLKVMLDEVFGIRNFRNEIVWCYTGPGSPKMRQFNRKHDTLLWYSGGGDNWTFNADAVRIPHKALNTNRKGAAISDPLTPALRNHYIALGKVPETWWPEFSPVGRRKSERMGYPTQKPLALLQRIIRASSNPGDTVMDPFCGSGTTCVAAVNESREWIGIDRSPVAASIVEQRMQRL